MFEKNLQDALSKDIVDEAKVRELVELDDHPEDEAGFVQEIFGLFKNSGPQILASLIAALQANDHKQLAYSSHKLKGSAGSLGFLRLSAVCQIIETGYGDFREVDRAMIIGAILPLVNEAIEGFSEILRKIVQPKP